MSNELTHARLISALRYELDTGKFYRRSSSYKKCIGREVGKGRSKNGYIYCWIDGGNYSAHLLAWFYVNGNFPADGIEVDHINRNRSDNRICNLRLCDKAENHHNQKLRGDCSSGAKGVRTIGNRFQARITVDGKLTTIGTFDTKEEAVSAYDTNAVVHFGDFAATNAVLLSKL